MPYNEQLIEGKSLSYQLPLALNGSGKKKLLQRLWDGMIPSDYSEEYNYTLKKKETELLIYVTGGYPKNLNQFNLVTQSWPTLCNPMNRSTPGLPVHHQLPEFTQTHVHRVSDAIQPSSSIVPFSSCPQSLPAPESFPMSQLFA